MHLEMQKKKLEIEADRLKNEENRVKLAVMVEENQIMMADLSIMDTEQRAWILKKQKMIRDRDDA